MRVQSARNCQKMNTTYTNNSNVLSIWEWRDQIERQYERLPYWYKNPQLQQKAYENYVKRAQNHEQRMAESEQRERE